MYWYSWRPISTRHYIAFSRTSTCLFSRASKILFMIKSRSPCTSKLAEVYGIECSRALIASLQGSFNYSCDEMLFVSASMIWFLRSCVRSSGCKSSQMWPIVWREAILIYIYSFEEFVHRLAIKSDHSPRGISISAIDEIKLAMVERTRAELEARVAMIATFTFSLKSPGSWIHRPAYFSS